MNFWNWSICHCVTLIALHLSASRTGKLTQQRLIWHSRVVPQDLSPPDLFSQMRIPVGGPVCNMSTVLLQGKQESRLPLRCLSHPLGSWSDVHLSTDSHDTQGLEKTESRCKSGHHDRPSVDQTVLLLRSHEPANTVTCHLTGSTGSGLTEQKPDPASGSDILAPDSRVPSGWWLQKEAVLL